MSESGLLERAGAALHKARLIDDLGLRECASATVLAALDVTDDVLVQAIARSTCTRTGSPVCALCEPFHRKCRQRGRAALVAIRALATHPSVPATNT